MAEQEPPEQLGNPPPLAPPVPPTTPLPYAPAEPPRSIWPTVIGVIAIIFGSFGILGATWTAIREMVPGLAGALASQPASVPHAAAMIGGLINLALAVLLLIGGIKLLSRRVLAVRLLKTWAVVDIITTIGGLAFAAIGVMPQIRQTMQQSGGAPPLPAGAMEAMVFGGMCIGLLLGIAPAVFVLIWFARRRIKDEVATWA